jgi:hypothetical protein
VCASLGPGCWISNAVQMRWFRVSPRENDAARRGWAKERRGWSAPEATGAARGRAPAGSGLGTSARKAVLTWADPGLWMTSCATREPVLRCLPLPRRTTVPGSFRHRAQGSIFRIRPTFGSARRVLFHRCGLHCGRSFGWGGVQAGGRR